MGTVVYKGHGEVHTAPQGSSTSSADDSEEGTRRSYALFSMKGWC